MEVQITRDVEYHVEMSLTWDELGILAAALSQHGRRYAHLDDVADFCEGLAAAVHSHHNGSPQGGC